MIVSVFSGLTSCSYNCCVKIVLLVFDSSLSRVILLMIPGHTADSYNCCFRNFGISKVETAKGVFMTELGVFGVRFTDCFRSPLMMLFVPCLRFLMQT